VSGDGERSFMRPMEQDLDKMQPVVQSRVVDFARLRGKFYNGMVIRKQRRVLLHLKPNVQDASTFGLFKKFHARTLFCSSCRPNSYEVPNVNRKSMHERHDSESSKR